MTVKQIRTKIEQLEKQRADMVARHATALEIYPITMKLAHLYNALNEDETEGLSR